LSVRIERSIATRRRWLIVVGLALAVASTLGANGFSPVSASTGWAATTGHLVTARYGQTAILLNTGKVLVAGGTDASGGILASAELFDPTAGTWAATGSLGTARSGHTATLLTSGKVLVAGGYGSAGNLSSAELFTPSSGTWAATGSLAATRVLHTSTLLDGAADCHPAAPATPATYCGKVLVSGGLSLASAELYDPTAATWSATGSMAAGRWGHTATLLTSGKVLVAGGHRPLTSPPVNAPVTATAEIYDPSAGTWSTTGSMNTPRTGHTATLLDGTSDCHPASPATPAAYCGRVLVAGDDVTTDYLQYNPIRSEVYDPALGTWAVAGPMATSRWGHSATLLSSGKVLVAGGCCALPLLYGSLATAEIYDPAGVVVSGAPVQGTWSSTTSMGTSRSYHTATWLTGNTVLVTTGMTDPGMPAAINTAEIYTP